jgi:hypothetical protein
MKPTVGRIVHYIRTDDTVTLAAIITFVSDISQASKDPEENGMPLVNLVFFHPSGKDLGGREGASYSKTPKPGCWSWPPRSP